MENHEKFLKKLKDEIETLPLDDKKRVELIEIYNDEVNELLLFVEKPLPTECELDDSLMSKDYKEFKDYFKKNGYYTFKKFIKNKDIIAEVKIKKVKKGGTMIQAEVINLYRGNIPPSFEFYASLSWKPKNWFKVGETCLILLQNNKTFEHTAFVMNNKMPIISENNERYVICYDCEPEFWGNAKTIVISKDIGTGVCKVLYDDVIDQIKNN